VTHEGVLAAPARQEQEMDAPEIVLREEWLARHENLLQREKAMTHALDALAAERRRSPWERVVGDYVFEAPERRLSLADLFAGRSQLIVYHHMLKAADESPCPGCCMVADHIGNLAHLHARDTSLVLVSRAPVAEIEAFKKRMGWTMPWFSTVDEFNADFGVARGFGLNVFVRRGKDVYRTYFTSGRGVEALGATWTFLDLTPFGRQEDWQESLPGVPLSAPYKWWRLHDEYSERLRAGGCCGAM
jgi:predicted dithiol-disulfide oxidoreductase (DUF899 family)